MSVFTLFFFIAYAHKIYEYFPASEYFNKNKSSMNKYNKE